MAFTSNLTVADAAALATVGLRPVGHVFGACVFHVGFSGTSYCGGADANAVRRDEYRNATRMAGEWSGFGATVAALRKVRRRALEKVTADAVGLGADGVVALQLEISANEHDKRAVQCTAFGTAVRSDGEAHPPKPFLCSLPAVDVVALMGSGWMPLGIALGVAVEIEHGDAATRAVTGWRNTFGSNAEVPAVTTVLERARAEARRTMDGELTRMGAEGGVVTAMTTAADSTKCEVYVGLTDYVAEAVTVATGIVQARELPRVRRTKDGRPRKRVPAGSLPRPTPMVPMRVLSPVVRPTPEPPLRPAWLE